MKRTLKPGPVEEMDPAALALLACPQCHGALRIEDAQQIACSACGLRFPVRDGLPVLLIAAARK